MRQNPIDFPPGSWILACWTIKIPNDRDWTGVVWRKPEVEDFRWDERFYLAQAESPYPPQTSGGAGGPLRGLRTEADLLKRGNDRAREVLRSFFKGGRLDFSEIRGSPERLLEILREMPFGMPLSLPEGPHGHALTALDEPPRAG